MHVRMVPSRMVVRETVTAAEQQPLPRAADVVWSASSTLPSRVLCLCLIAAKSMMGSSSHSSQNGQLETHVYVSWRCALAQSSGNTSVE